MATRKHVDEPPTQGKPVIPLRPLSMTDIFIGALGYVRANPRPTLGLTTVVIVTLTVIDLVGSALITTVDGMPQEVTGAAAGALVSLPVGAVLSGMLTVIVARSVLGVAISAAEAWQRVLPRVPALVGLSILAFTATAIIVAAPALAIMGLNNVGGRITATLIAIPLALLALSWVGTALLFAPAAIVLERKSFPHAITRSLSLVKGRFWRTLGVMLLAVILTGLLAGAISVPIGIAGALLGPGQGGSAPTAGGAIIASIGPAIGQFITIPLLAGVATLLYVDARIRSEALDSILIAYGSLGAESVWLDD